MKYKIIVLFMLLGMMVQLGCMKEKPDCTQPEISISANPSTCTERCTVTLRVVFKEANKKIADKSTYDWDFQNPLIPDSDEASPQVVFPGPGPYSIKLRVTNDKSYCEPLVATLNFTVEDGGPIANFSMNPATGICILGACPGTCGITFTNQSTNAERVVWTFRGQNGRGAPVAGSGNNPVLPDQFNQPDTVKVLLQAFNGAKSHEKSGVVIIRPETYVSKAIKVVSGNDPETPVLIAENGGTFYIGSSIRGKLVVSQVNSNELVGAPANLSLVGFPLFQIENKAYKSVKPGTPNIYFLAATAFNTQNFPFSACIQIGLDGGISILADTIGPKTYYSQGKSIVEKIGSTDLLIGGTKMGTSGVGVESIILSSTKRNFTFDIIPPRTEIIGRNYDLYNIIEDGGSYWASVKQLKGGALENAVLQFNNTLSVINSAIYLGTDRFIAKKMVKYNANTILLIGNQDNTATLYKIDINSRSSSLLFSAPGWSFNDAILNNGSMLICVGKHASNGKNRAASLIFNLDTGRQMGTSTYYDSSFSNPEYSEISTISKLQQVSCGLLLAGFVKMNGVQNSFFTKTDSNGTL